MLTLALTSTPDAHYYQGLHDVGAALLLALPGRSEDHPLPPASAAAARLVGGFLRPHVGPDLEGSMAMLDLVYVLLSQVQQGDPVWNVLTSVGLPPHFAMAWIMTLFSHDVEDGDVLGRIWDALFATHPVFVVYVAVALILDNAGPILECAEDFGALHTLCGSLASDPECLGPHNVERIIAAALDMAHNTLTPQELLASSSKPHLLTFGAAWPPASLSPPPPSITPLGAPTSIVSLSSTFSPLPSALLSPLHRTSTVLISFTAFAVAIYAWSISQSQSL